MPPREMPCLVRTYGRATLQPLWGPDNRSNDTETMRERENNFPSTDIGAEPMKEKRYDYDYHHSRFPDLP